jgi:hypothetical protein
MIEFFFLHIDAINLISRIPIQESNLTVLAQNCSFEATWYPLINFVQDDLLKYKSVFGGSIDYSELEHIEVDEKKVNPELFPGYPRLLTQDVIQIENPPELVELSNIPDQRILDELVKLLDEPNRGWAAHILIGKLLGHYAVSFDSKEKWWEEEGKTGKAKQAWTTYIQKVKPTMEWDPNWGYADSNLKCNT